MQRRMCARLAMAASALALVVGMTLPAGAQEEKTPKFVRVLPTDSQVLLTWAAVANATGYKVYRRGATDTAEKAVLVNAQPTKETSLTDASLKNGTPLIYSVKAVFSDGSMGDPSEASGTPHAALLGKFQFYDIQTMHPGSVTVDDKNVLTIRAAGADVWDTQDGQTFLATPVSGDFTLRMKLNKKPVIEKGESSDFGKVGLQAKFSLTPGDPYALVFASVTRDPEYLFEGRTNPGGGDGNWSGPSSGNGVSPDDAKFPVWLQLTRRGSTFSASYSYDGKTFQRVYDDQTMQNVPAQMFVGITATALNDDAYVNGTIDATSVTITTP